MSSQQDNPTTNGVHSPTPPASQTPGGTQYTDLPPQTQVTTPLPSQGAPDDLQRPPSQSQSLPNDASGSFPAAPPSPTAGAPPPQAPSSTSSSSAAPRPRDVRLIELLLNSAGVTSYEPRVPLLLVDFAWRHTQSVLADAIHLSHDPYTTNAGARPSAASGATAVPPPNADAVIRNNAVRLAIASRLNYQYRSGSGAVGISRDFMQDLARERNAVVLPKMGQSEWGVRLPNERFLLTGSSWGLTDHLPPTGDGLFDEEDDEVDHNNSNNNNNNNNNDNDDDDDEDDGDEDEDGDKDFVMGGTETTQQHTQTQDEGPEEDVDGGNEDEPGAMEDVFGHEDAGEEMEE